MRRGDVIGQMLKHMDKYVLELILHTAENQRTNPAPFFDLSGLIDNIDFLSQPMANFFTRNAEEAGISVTSEDTQFAHNLGLDGEDVYLHKLIELIFHSYNLIEQGLTIDDIMQWNDDDDTITVFFFDEVHLFIPVGMCEEEALQNHHLRQGMNGNNFSPFAHDGLNMQNDGIDIEFHPYLLGNERAITDTSTSSSELELIGDAREREAILEILQELTNSTLTVRRGGMWLNRSQNRPWLVEARHWLGGDTHLRVGTDLINALIHNEHRTSIQLTNNQSNVSSRSQINNFCCVPGVGAGSRVYLNINANPFQIVMYEDGYTRLQRTPLAVMLGHELIHSYRFSRGIRNRTGEADIIVMMPYGTYIIPPIDLPIVPFNGYILPAGSVRLERGSLHVETERIEELETIGIRHMRNGSYWEPSSARFTENALREEHGLLPRVSHFTIEIRVGVQ